MTEPRTEKKIRITEQEEEVQVRRRREERRGSRRKEERGRKRRRGRRLTVIYLNLKRKKNLRRSLLLNPANEDVSPKLVKLRLLRIRALSSQCQQFSSCVNSMD